MITRPVHLRRALLPVAVLAGVWAATVWITGGGSIAIGPVRLSSRAAARPALLALVLTAIWVWTTGAAERRETLGRLRARVDRLAPPAAIALALAAVAVSAIYGTHVAGGSDSSGYVSQSRLWAAGRLTADAPVLGDGGEWPARGWLVAPLGYVPTSTPDVLGPTYAPGLPWLMALGAMAFGDAGRYVWTPLAIGLLAWATFAWTRREAPAAAALGAAILVATAPPVLFAAMQVMSDLPAAALWAVTLVALAGRERPALPLAVAASALALAIRPNLVPAAGLVWLTAVVAMRGSRRERLRLAVALAVPMLAVAAAVAAINRHVWGEALMSGYGAPGEIFLAENVVPNLARLWQWTLETRAYWMIAAVPALLWLVATGARARWWPAAALTAGVVASYVSYAVFVEWWYLRFYLAAWPVLASAAAIAAWRLAVRWSAEAAGPVVLAVAAVVGASALVQTASRGVFDLWRVEHRYAAVARWVRTATAPDAVVACVQHSGAIADGTGRTLLRWDAIDPAALDRLVERLADRRRSAWLVVDDWEEAPFRERFGRSSARGRLEWAPTAEARVGTSRVRIYDLTSPTRAQAPVLIPVIGGGPWPWRRDPAQPAHLPAR